MTVTDSILRDVPPSSFFEKFVVVSPVTGAMINAQYAATPLTRAGLLGESIALRCSGNEVLSPIAGWVESCPATGYRVTLRHSSKLRLMLKIGPGTERLMGERCNRMVKSGQKVEVGTPLLTFDPIWLKQLGIDPVCTVSVSPDPRLQALVPSTLKRYFATEDTLFTVYTTEI